MSYVIIFYILSISNIIYVGNIKIESQSKYFILINSLQYIKNSYKK